MMSERVFVSGIFHEGHSFTSLPTERCNFTTVSGQDLLTKARRSSSILGGAVRALDKAGLRLVPGLSAVAPPGGGVRDTVYQDFKARILEAIAAEKPDAVFLELHGAMLTESLTDPEGDLLAAVRAALGPDRPIATALDLHAHVTPLMLENATICLACKENPHTDYAEAGARAADLLADRLRSRLSLTTAAAWVPLLIGARLETGDGPLRALHDLRVGLQADEPNILDISIYNPTPYLDAGGAGQCVTVVTDGRLDLATRVAETIAADFWRRRNAFTVDGPSLERVIESGLRQRCQGEPLVLGDKGDRVLAGAPGDDTQLMHLFSNKWPERRVLVPITDPRAVHRARDVGVGDTLRIAVGGCYSSDVVPYEAAWQVVHLGEGRFVQRGPYLAGEPAELGPTAVLTAGALTVLATSRPGFTQDPNAFESNGVDLRDFDIIVTKSGTHFKISFADIGNCIVVDTPGMTNYRLGGLPYRHRRPVYPEDDIVSPDLSARLFGQGAKVTQGTC